MARSRPTSRNVCPGNNGIEPVNDSSVSRPMCKPKALGQARSSRQPPLLPACDTIAAHSHLAPINLRQSGSNMVTDRSPPMVMEYVGMCHVLVIEDDPSPPWSSATSR